MSQRNRKTIRPRIDGAVFGSITIDGREIENDVILRLDGTIKKRKKKLSKKIYGTSHTISLEEVRYIHEKGAEVMIIGNGHCGLMGLSDEAKRYLKKQGCRIKSEAAPKAIHTWHTAGKKAIALFHVTC